MLGLRLVRNETTEIDDEQGLAREEDELRLVEARLAACDLDIDRRDSAIREAREKLCRQLEACSQPESPVLGELRALRPRCREDRELPEVARAFVERRRALAARRKAVDARERRLVLREKVLAQAQAEVAGLEQVLREAEATLEQTRRDEAEERRKQEEKRELTVGSAETAPVASWQERRLDSRIQLQTEVTLASDSNLFTGFSSDLSRGGIFVATCQLVPIGTQVEVRLDLPEGTRIEVRGVVRWSREPNERFPEFFPGVGIQFTELEDEPRRALESFAASREPLFFPD
ncbi:MAG TPA: hypothetical protein DFS52_19930 [Myxococcales bacterium]|jgi:uncharacterized protein (TIGR02266 family)|nr:hypothetical protein [Myxococcales bacterium]